MRGKSRAFDWWLLLALVIPIIGVLPMFGEGMVNAADAPFHAHRIFAMARLIEAGDLYPRWAPWFHVGYGYPVFTYYAPGATHLGAWLHLLGFDVVSAFSLCAAIAFCAGSVGTWLLARSFLPLPCALLACCLWVYAPSRFYEFWYQGSLAQIVATSFIPFVFYGILLARRMPGLRSGLWLALPLALVILTHTPTAYIVLVFAMPFCLAACLASATGREAARRALFIGAGLALGLGLSAIFWLPVAAELQYVKIGGELPDTVEFLRQKFLSPGEVASLPRLVDGNDKTLRMSRTLGALGAILSAAGVAALLYRRRYAAACLLAVGLAAALALTMEPSLDVWLAMPGFRNLRFPARILRMAALFVALLGASCLLWLPARYRMAAAVLLSALAVAQALPWTRPRDDRLDMSGLSAKDEIEMEYRERNWGTTSYNEYLPMFGQVTPFGLPTDLRSYIDEPLRIRVVESDFERRNYEARFAYLADNQIAISVAGKRPWLRLRQFYMPGWRLTVNDEPHPFRADEKNGLVQWLPPEGESVARLEYVGTTVQHIAALASLATVGIGLLILKFAAAPPRPAMRERSVSLRAALLASGVLVAFAVLNAAALQDQVFRASRDDGTPAYMRSQVNATFDDAVTLLGYTLLSDSISDNAPLNIRLYWRLESAPASEYRPVAQLVDLPVTGAWAVSQPQNFEGGSLADLAPGEFMSDDHSLRLLADAPGWVGRISVQLRDAAGDRPFAALPDGSDRVLLPEVIQIHRPDRPFQGESLQIAFGDYLTLHCIETSRAGRELTGKLHWEAREQPPLDLHQFAHGLNAGGNIVSQRDSEPLEGRFPTSHWRKGQHVASVFSLELADGVYEVALGLYNPADGARAPATVDGQRADRILIAPENSSCR